MTIHNSKRGLRLLVLGAASALLVGVAATYADADAGSVTSTVVSSDDPLDRVPVGLRPPPPTTVATTTTATTPPTTAAATTTAPPRPAAPAPTAPPPPPPSTSAAAPPPTTAPAPPPPPAPPPESAYDRVVRAYNTGVPGSWRARINVRFEIIEGSTSWAHSNGVIAIGSNHANGNFNHLVDVVAHEFGHQVAYRFGSQAYPGAAPEGWPAPPQRPEEAWADCVQTAFTGRINPSHGLPPCAGEQRSWAANWLAGSR